MLGRGVNFFAQAFLDRVGKAIGTDQIRIADLPEEARKRMRRQQMRGAIDQMRVFVVGNTVFGPVLSFQAWGMGINAVVLIWTGVILIFSWWQFFRWSESYETDGSSADMASFVAETRLNASIWCMGMVLFFPALEGDAKTILTTVMAGSLALGTVGFAQAPRAAFWYLGIQTTVLTLVPLVTGTLTGSGSDIVIGCLSLVAGVAIFNATLERAKAQARAFINLEALTQKTEVVDLLLKDYEEQGVEWLWRTNAAGCLITGPQQVLDLIGVKAGESCPTSLLDAIGSTVDPLGQDAFSRLKTAFADRADFHEVILPFQDPELQSTKWIMMRGRPQYDGGTFSGFRGIFADATTTVQAQRQIEFLADHDPLTGLANRNVVKRHLENLDVRVDHCVALLIDLDGFKQVNDSYGHAIGDRLLEDVAHRLQHESGVSDLVARLGGDEFLVLVDLSNRTNVPKLDDFVNRLLVRLSQPYLIEHFELVTSASIGRASFPQDTSQGPALLIQADLALYDAKQRGRNQCCVFLAEMQTGMQKRLVVTERLKAAISDDRIIPHYQPQYSAQTGELVGFEALARWNDPSLGAVGPDIFIPIAEETGLIHDLGERLLRRACTDAVEWAAISNGDPPLLSVNLSPAQVTRGDVVQLVRRVLEQTGLPPTQLEIEITEGVLIYDKRTTCEVLRDLSFLGVRIALDDFGTGYSSLSYIRALPLDRLKIDRAFVADLDDPTARPIVQTIIDLCATLDLQVVAEGVETEDHIQTLRAMRCDVLQGYYFSPALPANKAFMLIRDQKDDGPRTRNAG